MEPLNNEPWIEPAVVPLAGISAEELARYKNPAAFDGSGGAITQPVIDEANNGPHMTNYPPGHYEATMGIPDEVALNTLESKPPVSV